MGRGVGVINLGIRPIILGGGSALLWQEASVFYHAYMSRIIGMTIGIHCDVAGDFTVRIGEVDGYKTLSDLSESTRKKVIAEIIDECEPLIEKVKRFDIEG
jgi:hypothetical protein